MIVEQFRRFAVPARLFGYIYVGWGGSAAKLLLADGALEIYISEDLYN